MKLAIVAGCLVVCLLLHVYMRRRASEMTDQQAAARWAPDGSFAQISCFFKEDVVTSARIRELLYNLETALKDSSVLEEQEASQAIRYCYSKTAHVSFSTDAKTATFPAVVAGGDFFLFHPARLMTGTYFTSESFMKDGVVLDENSAWQLFGGTNLAGQAIEYDDKQLRVSGVIRNEEGRIATAAGLDGALVYLTYDAIGSNGGSDTGEGETIVSSGDNVQCLELLLPEPVKGFAVQLVREKLGVSQDNMTVIDNTRRFSYPALYTVLSSFGTRSMQTASYSYPYWENIALGTEDVFAVLFVIQMLLLAVAIILVTEMIVNGYRHKKWTAAGVYESASNAVYDVQARYKAHKLKWKDF